MEELILAFGAVWGIAVVVFLVLVLLIPVMIYTGQKWAFRCFQELKELNRQTEETNDQLEALSVQIAGQQRAIYQLGRGRSPAIPAPRDADQGPAP